MLTNTLSHQVYFIDLSKNKLQLLRFFFLFLFKIVELIEELCKKKRSLLTLTASHFSE